MASMSERPRRQKKKVSRSEDYIDNIDAELEAIESLPVTVAFPSSASVEGGPRKRGRPRKYPQAPPPAPEIQPMKRPRGRPRGSGKHQRAAAALMAALTESGVSRAGTGTDVSEGGPDRGAPGNGVSPSTTDGHGYGYRDGNRLSLSHLGALNHDLHIFTPSGEAGENGTHTPHYPPRVVPPLDTIVEDGIQTDQMKIKGRNGTKESSVVVKNEKMIEARLGLLKSLSGVTEMETPTPKPRNRRKVANPTKTE